MSQKRLSVVGYRRLQNRFLVEHSEFLAHKEPKPMPATLPDKGKRETLFPEGPDLQYAQLSCKISSYLFNISQEKAKDKAPI